MMTVAEERARRAFDKVQANEGRGVYEFMLAEFEAGFKPDLRDYFAGQAPVNMDNACRICGFKSDTDLTRDVNRETLWAVMASCRYEYADAMLAERAK